MKKGKIAIISIVAVILAVLSIFTVLINIYQKNDIESLSITDETANVQVKIGNKTFNINQNYIPTKEFNNTKYGKDIVKKAAEILGASYNWGDKGRRQNSNGYIYVADADTVTNEKSRGVDCSGLISWTLRQLHYNITGLTNTDNGSLSVQGRSVPDDCSDWLLYGAGNYPFETGVYEDTWGTNDWKIKKPSQHQYAEGTTAGLISKLKCSVDRWGLQTG